MRGIFIDLTTEAIEKRLGITVIHRNFPWIRTVYAVKNGKVDGFLSFAERHGAHFVIFGMEMLDSKACDALKAALNHPSPVFSAQEYDACQMSAILNKLSILITSRYHARVLSLSGGVPAIAVSMDERLENIYEELNQLDDFYSNRSTIQASWKQG